jgi:hypothetical protein
MVVIRNSAMRAGEVIDGHRPHQARAIDCFAQKLWGGWSAIAGSRARGRVAMSDVGLV